MTSSLMQKLRDPHGLVEPKKLAELEKKISACLTGMFRQPNQGGNPFLFALTIAKPHILAADADLARACSDKSGKAVPGFLKHATAATDGRTAGR